MGFGGWEDQASHLVQGTLLSLVQQAVLCHLGVTCQSNSAGLLLPLVVGVSPGALCGSYNNKVRDVTECLWAGPSLVAKNVTGI